MFYDIVFFLSPEAVAAGAKVTLIGSVYTVKKDPATTIQAVRGARPPADQAAEVAALKAQVAALQGQVDTLTQQLADCRGSQPVPLPTISGMTVTPANLPEGGGSVVIDAVVTGAVSLTLDGAAVVLPATVVV